MPSKIPSPSSSDPASPGALAVFGAGFVGGAFAAAAVARGWRVSALTRNAARAAALRAAGCETVVEADLAGEAWHAGFRGPFDFVLDCVGAGGGGEAAYRRCYVDGLRSIGRWMAGQPAGGTIVYTGSTGVYPQGGGVEVTEEAPTADAVGTGRILVEAEAELARGAAAARWRWFVLRLAGIYGPGRHGLLDLLRAGAPVLPGDPSHRLNLIHRDDVCGAVLACLAAPAGVGARVFNVADGAPAPRAEVAAWLADRLGRECPPFEGAGAPAGPDPFGRRGRAPDRRIVAAAIRRELGWAPLYPDFRAGYGAILAGGGTTNAQGPETSGSAPAPPG